MERKPHAYADGRTVLEMGDTNRQKYTAVDNNSMCCVEKALI